ncbi:diaminopimelate decarboxylase [Heliomicrobium modesticaldum Ice1]|uniref:Diaminopimelate decarboxylase n=1 Tax=Heliobacterium modesticaldum (strain ATCC 51547 / Ice1) TaxID=498761 RepID=B0TFB9_HELMI|nr:diaminopimelate decarboxylase [Heliomicrobium modesticaldum]ABZ84436.1 diaminopimelate decarboxylase [Heliomicrobium modesticaldum Ice1]
MKLHGTATINERGNLAIGGCDATDLIKEFGSPLYVMDEAHLRENCRKYYQAFSASGAGEVLFASKAFMTMAMCRLVEQEGLGLDVVSGGELYTARRAGFPMEKVYFHGNNKTPAELRQAIEYGVGHIVVDNLYEADLLNAIAGETGALVRVLLRITPGIDCHTHEFVRTGQIDSKFGFTLPTGQALAGVKAVLERGNLIYDGLHCHIGSQIFELESFGYAAEVMMTFIDEIRRETGVETAILNLGGGFGIRYTEADTPGDVAEYARIVLSAVALEAEKRGLPTPKVLVEPGRSIVATAGTTLYTVGSVKEIIGVRKYVAVDGGMTDNPRPALYGSRYESMLANKATQEPEEVVSVTGKCCESGDMLLWDVSLPKVESGDILAVSCTGAYNYTMSMNYNRIGRPAVVFVRDGKAAVVVERESLDDLIRNDRIPPYLQR